MRIPYAKQLLSSPDYLHNFTDLAIWSIVECALGLTATSLATLRPLFVRINMLASTQILSTYHSRSHTGRRHGGAATGKLASSRAASQHRPPPPRSRGFSEPPMSLNSLDSQSQLSPKAAPPPFSKNDFRVPPEHSTTNNQNGLGQEVPSPPPVFFPARDRSHTIPPSRESQADYVPRPPSVGTLDGQRQSRDETWFLPLQPPPPPRGSYYHSRGFSS